MTRRFTLSGEALTRMMGVAHQLGEGTDLDDILDIIARTATDVIGFDAVAVNVRRDDENLEVRAVVGPPEVEQLRGGILSDTQWLTVLESCERWDGLFFSRSPTMPADVPSADPWHERFSRVEEKSDASGTEPWKPEFALLAPVWSRGVENGTLQGVISLDMPRSGRTPDAEQRMLLHLFATQVGIAIDRVSEANSASDRVTLYRAAFAESPLATVLLDSDLRLTDVNDAFLELADAVPGDSDNRLLTDFLDPDTTDFVSLLGALGPGATVSAPSELRLRHPRGVEWDRWVEVTARRVDTITEDPLYVCTLTDRTTARKEMMAIRHRADHDALTGLSARPVWLEDLQDQLTRRIPPVDTGRADSGRIVGVLFCDLDSFKQVNDVSDHEAGDRTLVVVAGILRAVCAQTDAVCRWGGDEFVIAATRDTESALMDLGSAITHAVEARTATADTGDPVAGVAISIGIAAVRATTHVDSTTMIQVADSALYRSKSDITRSTHMTVL